jgi:hypothetical protein
MNKKVIIITLFSIFSLAIVVEVIFLFKKNPTPPHVNAPLSTYQVSVTNTNGKLTGNVSAGGAITTLNQDNVSQYVTLSFNTPRDIMRLECPTNYTLHNPTSPSGNTVTSDPVIGSSIEIIPNVPNTLNIQCDKN